MKNNVFGWDIEWAMSFDFHKDAVKRKKLKESTSGIDYQVEDDVYPFMNMYDPANTKKDRLIEDWQTVADKIRARAETNDKIILLMHDRAFRRDSIYGNDEADELRCLINALKKTQAVFKGLLEWRYP